MPIASFITDIHIKKRSNVRTDDFYNNVLEKINYFCKRSVELGVYLALLGGDIGDSYNWKYPEIVHDLEKIFSSYPSLSFYTPIGNHDIPGRNLDEFKDTSLSTLNKLCNNLQVIRHGKVTVPGPIDLWFFSSDDKPTEDLLKGQFSFKKNNKSIAIIHAPVGPGFIDPKTLNLPFNVALFGDIHTGWKPFKRKGCYIANPGSLTRLTKADRNRKPMMAIINDDFSVTYEEIPCVFPVFNEEKIKEEEEKIGKAFVAAIENKNNTEKKDPKTLVRKIGKKAKFSKESIDKLIEELK